MSNFIKFPLVDNAVVGVPLDPSGNLNGTATGGGTLSQTGVTPNVPIASSSGSGLGATISVNNNGQTAIGGIILTTVDGGDDYKVGDTITLAAVTTGATSRWSADIVYTLLADDLLGGTITRPFIMIPIDNVGAIKKGTAAAIGTNGTCEIQLKQVNATSGVGASVVTKFLVTLDDTVALSSQRIVAGIAQAVAKASEAENSVPAVKFIGDAKILSVQLS
jgi:hypothetical protein